MSEDERAAGDGEGRPRDDEGRDRASGPERGIKVTDRRMFTPEGELREEYRFLEERSSTAASPAAAGGDPLAPAQRSVETPAQASDVAAHHDPQAAESADAGGEEGPGFLDLVGALAEPASVYLGDVPLPDGRRHEDLAAARFHIDLLDVLRRKSRGQLDARESAVLDDVIYRLRMRFMQKSG